MNIYHSLDETSVLNETERLKQQVNLGWSIEKLKIETLAKKDTAITFLDLGCGPGFFSNLVAESFPLWSVIGIDSSDDLLPKNTHLPNSQFILGDITSIPLADKSVDIVYCRFLFQHTGAQEKIFTEIKRVLKHGGTVAILDVDDRGVIFSPEQIWASELYQKVNLLQKQTGGDRNIGALLPGLLVQYGFESINLTVVPITNYQLPIKAILELATGLKRNTLVKFGEHKFANSVAESIESFVNLPDATIFLPLFFCTGKIPSNL